MWILSALIAFNFQDCSTKRTEQTEQTYSSFFDHLNFPYNLLQFLYP